MKNCCRPRDCRPGWGRGQRGKRLGSVPLAFSLQTQSPAAGLIIGKGRIGGIPRCSPAVSCIHDTVNCQGASILSSLPNRHKSSSKMSDPLVINSWRRGREAYTLVGRKRRECAIAMESNFCFVAMTKASRVLSVRERWMVDGFTLAVTHRSGIDLLPKWARSIWPEN